MSKTFGAVIGAACGAIALLAGGEAQAHAKLLDAAPAQDSTVAAPARIVLHFSETLEPKFSGLDLSAAGAKVAVASSVGEDRKTLIGAPAKPLAPGPHLVNWHVVSSDGHRIQGSYAFTVR